MCNCLCAEPVGALVQMHRHKCPIPARGCNLAHAAFNCVISRRMFEQSHPSLSDDDDFQFPATSVGPANTETVRKN